MKRFLLLAILPASALLAQTPDPVPKVIQLAADYERLAARHDKEALASTSHEYRSLCAARAEVMRQAADMAKDLAADLSMTPKPVPVPVTAPKPTRGPAPTWPLPPKQPEKKTPSLTELVALWPRSVW